jgi:hypothetical protein
MNLKDLFYQLRLAEKVNYKKYRTMGIKDKNLIRILMDYDNLYFTRMFYHRMDVLEAIESIKDEMSPEELNGES